MRKLYLLFFIIIIIGCTNIYCVEKPDTLYKVTKIKTKGEYYIIYSKRNDSLFKIISKKVDIDKPNLEVLKKGNYYSFDFGDSNSEILPLSGIINNKDVKNKSIFEDGDTKIRFTKRFHYRLYITKNLIGLYYLP